MTRYLQILAFVLTALMGANSVWAATAAEPMAAGQDTTFIYMPNGRLDVYPADIVKSIVRGEQQVVVTTVDGKEHAYLNTAIQSVSNTAPSDKPLITSFKFNNKFNANLYEDVVCNFGSKGLITGSVPTIGKWLCPSFQLSDKGGLVYVGRKPQHSKMTRLSFAEPVDYVVTREGWQVMQLTQPDEDDDDGGDDPDPTPVNPELDENASKIELTADMLSTNAPTMRSDEDLPSLIDGNEYTYYHSTWSGSGYDPLPLDEAPWIEINIPEAIHYLQFRYETRSADNRWPLALRVDVSKDGETWVEVEEFTSEADGLPAASLQWWTSPVMDLAGDYKRLRIVCTQAAYKNYLCMAELEIYKVTPSTPTPEPDPDPDPELPSGATLEWQPYGTHYTVSIDFPADRAAGVPVVYITTDEGILPPDKYNFLTGTISLDGAGVFPDMEETPMQIRGRGNSSWAGQKGKSPYRVKFDSKKKPFGLKNGKNWVLLANRQTGSMMSNAIGMKVAQLAGAAGANHIIPVELYINGEYRGSYNWTEKVGISNNSIDLDDESFAAMLELDSYYDEPYKFRGYDYNMPCNIKFPDFDDVPLETSISPEAIEDDWDDLIEAVSLHRDISNYAQVDTLAAFYLTNDFILNQELMHPKSTFVYKERVGNRNDLWKFGPVWDLDWAFGYEGSSRYYQSGAEDDLTTRRWMEMNQFWIDLRQCGENFDRTYYLAWTRLLKLGAVEELQEFIDSYYEFANSSFQNNAGRWGDGWDYSSNASNAKSWLKKRANAVYKRLNTYDAEELLEYFEEWAPYGISDEPVQADKTPYIRVRTAVQNLLANSSGYVCLPTTKNRLEAAIIEQNNAVNVAEKDKEVKAAVTALRDAVVTFLSADELRLLEPIDLTDIFVNNASPIRSIEGWDSDEDPTFYPKTRTAEFLDQPGAEISQSVRLPAGTFQWTGVALTRSGYTAQLFVNGVTKRLTTVSSKTVNSHEEARAWFDSGKGVNTIEFELSEAAVNRLGLRADNGSGDHWLVWSDFHLVMTDKPYKSIATEELYLAANKSIGDGKHYRIFTQHNGKSFGSSRYYLTRGGQLTNVAVDDDVFVFTAVSGEVGTANTDLYVSPAWKTDACFTNPTLSDNSQGDLVSRGYISVNTELGRDNWEGQVWYKDGDFYAVRATNAPAGSWGADSFWTVEDIESDGTPEAGYSWNPCFYWQLEEVPFEPTYVLKYVLDGEEYKTESLTAGTAITPATVPEKEGYTFSGWAELPETMPAQDITVTGSYTVNSYYVRYYVVRQLFAEDKVDYGTPLQLREYTPDDPARYTFLGWDGEKFETMPAHDIEYHALIADGIPTLTSDDLRGVEAIYDTAGRKLSRLQRGVNVLRMSDGTVRKRLFK